VILSYVPDAGGLGGALESLKNIVYVLTVPVFDIARRILTRRRNAANPVASSEGPSLLTVAIVSALVLFIIIELLSVLIGFGAGSICNALGQSTQELAVANCFQVGVNMLAVAVLIPIFVAIGMACGWIWQRYLNQDLLKTLLLFIVAFLILFSIDYYLLIVNGSETENTKLYYEQMRQSALIFIAGKPLILAPSILLGYAAGKAWNGLARALA
jgi:hypothetical protein